MKQNRFAMPLLVLTGLTVNSFSARGEEPTIAALLQRIQELEQKVKILDRHREIDQEVATEKAKTTAVVSAGSTGFQIRSADTNFVLKVRGYAQADARFFASDNESGTANDTFLMRRVRPIIESTVFDKYDFRLMLDFGSGASATAANNGFVQDAYLNARFYPGFQVRIGKDKEPVGLERLQSGANLLFVERGYPTQLLPNRDVGIQIRGELFAGRLEYAVGAFNGVADGGSGDIDTADDEKDLVARAFAQPFKNSQSAALRGLGLGIAGTYGNQEGPLRNFVSPGQQRFFSYRSGVGTPAAPNVVADGEHWRITPQGWYYWGPFGLFGEYALSNQQVRRDDGAATFASLANSGWEVTASYFLTGEDNSFKAVTPKKPFTINGDGWGAWEVSARIGQLDVDDDAFPLFAAPATSAGGATSWGVGLNWHLNRHVKFNFNYEQTDFASGSTPLLTDSEKVILSRAQISF